MASDWLIGTWTYKARVAEHVGRATITFRPDGSYECVVVIGAPETSMTAFDKGAWTLTGNRLHLRMKDVDWQFTGPRAERGRAVFDLRREAILKNSESMRALVIRLSPSVCVVFRRWKPGVIRRVD